VEKEIGDIDGIVPDGAIIGPDTMSTIGLAVVGAAAVVIFVILLPEIAIGVGVGAAIVLVSGAIRPRRGLHGA
jgi:hypothetical protein